MTDFIGPVGYGIAGISEMEQAIGSLPIYLVTVDPNSLEGVLCGIGIIHEKEVYPEYSCFFRPHQYVKRYRVPIEGFRMVNLEKDVLTKKFTKSNLVVELEIK